MGYPNPRSSYLKAAFLNFISSENKRYNPELTKKRRIRPSKNEVEFVLRSLLSL
jgi:hypothetical protein